VIVLDGFTLTIGGVLVRATPGTVVRMPAGIPHALEALVACRMLLIMLRISTRPDVGWSSNRGLRRGRRLDDESTGSRQARAVQYGTWGGRRKPRDAASDFHQTDTTHP
jgi:hypothetical protein